MNPSPDYLHRLGDRIAEALSAVVPPDVSLLTGQYGLGGHPMEFVCGYAFVENVVDNQALNPDVPLAEIIEMVAGNLLASLQQDITMDLKVPWPPVTSKPLGYFAEPHAQVLGNVLHLSFDVDGRALVGVGVSMNESD